MFFIPIVIFQVTDKTFETKVHWGDALTEEHERFDSNQQSSFPFISFSWLLSFTHVFLCSYLVDEFYKKPVIIYDHPKELKPFNVRLNDDGKTVASFDVIIPKASFLSLQQIQVAKGQAG